MVYIPTIYKLWLSILFGIAWAGISIYLAIPWYYDLIQIYHVIWVVGLIGFVAIIPGFFNAFLIMSLLLDKRPVYDINGELPPISILIAAYNEESTIRDTLISILSQEYPNVIEIIVSNDGSKDNTSQVVLDVQNKYTSNLKQIRLIDNSINEGKASALNNALHLATYDVILSVDADSQLFKNALKHIVSNYINGPKHTAAVAGSILVRNSRNTWITKTQEWDYFHGIAVVKRAQSLYQGTLVAQGAFSLYNKQIVLELGGWKNCVGEDIVLTFEMISKGYRVGMSEHALAFTSVPEDYKTFRKQRERWSRGLIEAIRQVPNIIILPRKTLIFIWLNLMFPLLDFFYMFGLLPGIALALVFHWYYIAGIMTLILLPLSAIVNGVMFIKQRQIFKQHGLKVRQNYVGFLYYALLYQAIMSPACLYGYVTEFLNMKKVWGTK